MALTFISRLSIPVPIRGKLATEPQVTISDAGQMTFSTLAVKALGGKEMKKVGVTYDKETRQLTLFPQGHRSILKKAENELWDLKHSTKGNAATLSGSASFLNNDAVFGDEKYNYKDSGSQVLPVTEKSGCISYTIPKGTLPKRRITVRRKKVQTITSTPAPVPQPPMPPLSSDEPVLEMESA